MTDNSKPLLLAEYDTEAETAANLGVCVRTLRNWRRDKSGPPVTFIASRVYYYRPSTKNWLRAQERIPNKAA